MTSPKLGRFKRVNLDEVWAHEAADFTPWLAQESNIEVLGEAIGLELEVQSTEQSVGDFRVDIICRETAGQTIVLIENQLEKTDHRHLGQLMTYAAGLQAETIVWIASGFRDEHRAAIDWLNENTSDNLAFFGIEIELWRIGESDIAPRFNIVAQPNAWTRAVTSSAMGDSSHVPSELQQLQLDYWCGFRDYLLANKGSIRPTKAHPQGFMVFSIGRFGFDLTASIDSKKKRITATLTIGTDHAMSFFQTLRKNESEYQKQFADPLDWDENPKRRNQLVRIRLEEADPADAQDRVRQYEWLASRLNQLHRAFAKNIKELKIEDLDAAEAD